MAASCASEGIPRAPALRAVALTLGRPGITAPILEDVHFELARGEGVLLEGATGAGKSTLLRALAGLGGVEQRGGALVRSEPVTLLLQRVETQLLCTTVGEEVALGPRSLRLPSWRVRERVSDALERVGMAGSEGREVDSLSAGQKQRVVLAALLALSPRVLLLDEPSSALDPRARRGLVDVLAALKLRGAALLIADHAPAELRSIVDRCVAIEGGRLRERSGPESAAGSSGPPSPAARCDAPTEVVARPRLEIRRGERLLLLGPNGAGKSTWLRDLACRCEAPRARRGGAGAGWAGDVALVVQEPRRSLFARTVWQEIDFALQRRRLPLAARRARVRELLTRFELLPFADRSPLRLSFGEQHRLAIAAALAPRPKLVLIDEPFAGLDPSGRAALLALLEQEQARSGAALVFASHDRQPLAAWCDRVVALPARALSAPGPPSLPRPPLQFRARHSPLHRLGAGWKLLGATAMGALALALDGLPLLMGLSLLLAAGYAWGRLSIAELWRDLRWVLLQGVIVALLTIALQGLSALEAGCRTALQLLLVFAPFALVARTTPTEALLGPLRRHLPPRLGLALAAPLRFIPVFARELAELIPAQRLRGARLRARELWHPSAWRDWLASIAFPMTLRAIEVAEQAAEAAEIRGVGAGAAPRGEGAR